MPLIDQLLLATHERGGGAAALLLDPGLAARFTSGPRERVLTREPLDGPTIHRLLREMTPGGAPADASKAAKIEFRYPVGGAEFLVQATGAADGWHVSARPAPRSDEVAPPLSPLATLSPRLAPIELVKSAPAVRAKAVADVPTTRPNPGPGAPAMKSAGPGAGPAMAPAVTPEPVVAPPPAPVVFVEQPMVPLPPIADLLRDLVAARGSDLHLTATQAPRRRVDGDLDVIPGYLAPSAERLRELIWEITPERNKVEFEARNDSDFAYELPGTGRFRVNLFRDRLGISTVMRQIPEKIPSADDLGLPESLRRLAYLSKGLVLVTGPTGSGKSTTLAALIDLINRTRNDHIITIEDPVEFVHQSRKCLVNQREVHVHTESFKQALRAALREDPDIVMVGEMRDLETIAIAIETAETGHLVFGTLHTTTAISTIERLVDQFPGDRQEQVRMMLADSLKAVIAQTLLKKIGGGRVAAQEILLANPAVSNLIREGKTFQLASAMQTGKGKGMILLNDALLDLVKRGVVEPKEAFIKAVDKEGLLKAFKAADISCDVYVD